MSDKKGIGVTAISHDSENRTHVYDGIGYGSEGGYSSDIHYTGASLSQLASLTRVSSHCEQFIKYECYHSVLFNNGHQFGWWVARDSLKMKYWGGASVSNKCACGMTNSCVNPGYGCNCDGNENVWREDSGLLTDKTQLPVKQLRFGDIGRSAQLWYHLNYPLPSSLRTWRCIQNNFPDYFDDRHKNGKWKNIFPNFSNSKLLIVWFVTCIHCYLYMQ